MVLPFCWWRPWKGRKTNHYIAELSLRNGGCIPQTIAFFMENFGGKDRLSCPIEELDVIDWLIDNLLKVGKMFIKQALNSFPFPYKLILYFFQFIFSWVLDFFFNELMLQRVIGWQLYHQILINLKNLIFHQSHRKLIFYFQFKIMIGFGFEYLCKFRSS